MGDDGVGCRIAALLAADPRLPPDTEVLCRGSDLLRLSDDMAGRERVVLIDALLGEGAPGSVEVFEAPFPELAGRHCNAHRLSAPDAVGLLLSICLELRSVRFTLIAVTIARVEFGEKLSAPLEARLPEIVSLILADL